MRAPARGTEAHAAPHPTRARNAASSANPSIAPAARRSADGPPSPDEAAAPSPRPPSASAACSRARADRRRAQEEHRLEHDREEDRPERDAPSRAPARSRRRARAGRRSPSTADPPRHRRRRDESEARAHDARGQADVARRRAVAGSVPKASAASGVAATKNGRATCPARASRRPAGSPAVDGPVEPRRAASARAASRAASPPRRGLQRHGARPRRGRARRPSPRMPSCARVGTATSSDRLLARRDARPSATMSDAPGDMNRPPAHSPVLPSRRLRVQHERHRVPERRRGDVRPAARVGRRRAPRAGVKLASCSGSIDDAGQRARASRRPVARTQMLAGKPDAARWPRTATSSTTSPSRRANRAQADAGRLAPSGGGSARRRRSASSASRCGTSTCTGPGRQGERASPRRRPRSSRRASVRGAPSAGDTSTRRQRRRLAQAAVLVEHDDLPREPRARGRPRARP